MTNHADRHQVNLDRYQVVTPRSGGSDERRRTSAAPARARKPRRLAGWGTGIPLEWLEARALLSVTPTSIAVAASSALLLSGQSATLTATVTTPIGDPIPTSSDGTVTFYDGATPLGAP
jgi:hypothetical protein